jgi:hypothetical protein
MMRSRDTTMPEHWHMLDAKDQQAYRKLKRLIESLGVRTARERSPMSFRVILDQINRYIIQNNDNDWKRSAVIGMIWLGDDLAVSTTQLGKLIGKCKSSINSNLQSVGFAPEPMKSECAEALARAIPLIRSDPREARKWTLRRGSRPAATSFPQPATTSWDSSPSFPPELTEGIWSDDDAGLLFALGLL